MNEDPTKKQAHDLEDVRRGVQMRIDINTQGGKVLMLLIEAKLAERMALIAMDDPCCKGLLDVLDSVGYNVQLAADKSARLMANAAMGGH